MPQSVANWVQWPVSNITANPRHFNRVFITDPNLSLPRASGSAGLPYTQTGNLGLTNRPSSARVMIISTIGTSNAPVSQAAVTPTTFNDMWTTPLYSNPSTWAGTWTGTGQDICIQRLNLEPLFYQLILVNRDPGSTNGSFAINGTSSTATVVTNGYIWNNYYVAGSVVNLYSGTNFATSYVLQRNVSFVYENGAWGGQIMDCLNCTNPPPANTNLVGGFSTAASNFLNAAWYSSGKADDQQTILADMANFMLDYPMLANTAPPFSMYTDKGVPGHELDSIFNAVMNNNVIQDSQTMAPQP